MRTIEVHINDKGGEPIRQDTRTIKMEPGVGGLIKFPIVTSGSRFVQGEVRLVSSDPLAIDDVRYFTVGVNSPPRVLVIGENLEEADNLLTALAPDILKKQNRAQHIETYRSVRQVTEADINRNEIVCLVNLRGPSPELWEKLERFIEAGGGLAVFLGNSDIDATAYNTPEAQRLLPAKLLAPVKFFKGPFIVDLQNDQHALFRRILDSNDERAEFASVFYERAWSVEATEGSRVLATYNNARQTPAWLERPVGTGRTVLFSNSVDNIGDNGRPWSDFVTTWSFMRVTAELMHYLGHHADGRFNWISGQNAIVRFDRSRVQDQYLLRKPSRQQLPGNVPSDEDFVVLNDVNAAGHYRFSSGRGEDAFVSGFSVNSDDQESKFEPIKDAELDTLLGEGRYSKARHIEELDRAVQNSRLGQEIFPLLMVLVVIFFVGEHFVANYFYDDGATADTDATQRSKVATS